jgi:proline dehydrogenase
MGISRNILLWGSKNAFLKNKIPQMKAVQKALKRFMPGETLTDAIEAATKLSQNSISTTFTILGENINNFSEAESATKNYIDLLERIDNEIIDIEISLKLTQIGFDHSFEKTFELFRLIVQKAKECSNNVFIDIEDSSYVDNTIRFYKEIKKEYDNVGLCLQAYLYRTLNDIKEMISINPWIRLVKGAYKEPESVAFKNKSKVDENYFEISKYLLKEIREKGVRVAFATHDVSLQERIKKEAETLMLPIYDVEFQMLYGIKQPEQIKLANEGYNVRTLISYGKLWYPWYMRRLAERPANVGFLVKNLFR